MNKKIYGACLSYKCAKAQKHTKDCPLYGVPYPIKPSKIKKIKHEWCPYWDCCHCDFCQTHRRFCKVKGIEWIKHFIFKLIERLNEN